MKKNLRILTAFSLCLALWITAFASMTGCSRKMTYAPIATPEVTLPDLTDDRVLPTEKINTYEEMLETAFADIAPVSADDLICTADDNGELTVTGYTGGEVVVVIPDHIDSAPVKAIGEEAFKGHGNLKGLYIPDSVETIGFGAFQDCNSLEILRTPVVEVSAHPYFGALFGAANYEINASEVPDALKTLIIGGSVASIPAYGFFDCNSIECISLPSTVSTIEKLAFWGCYGLAYINLSETQLKSIGDRAFTNCAALLRFDLPASVTSIGEAVVEGCGTMSAMTLPFVGGTATENTYLGYLFGASDYTFTAGYVPASLQEITLLQGCTVIPDNAFFEVSCLKKITLPETVTSIGRRAFYGCERLSAISLPASVISIGDDAFHGCMRLQSVTFEEGLTELGVQAFMDCLSLKTVELPTSLAYIPNSCFAGCISLETVTAAGVISESQVGLQAYRHCDKLTQAPFLKPEISTDN